MTKKSTETKMLPQQDILVAERDARTDDLSKLSEFIESDKFKDVFAKDQILLERQKEILSNLVGVLNARIALL